MKLTKAMKEAAHGILRERIYAKEVAAMTEKEGELFEKIAKQLWGAKAWQTLQDLLTLKPDSVHCHSSLSIDHWKNKIHRRDGMPLPTKDPWNSPEFSSADLGASLAGKVTAHLKARAILNASVDEVRVTVKNAVFGCTTTEALYKKFPELRELVKNNPDFIGQPAANIAVIIDAETRKALGFPATPKAGSLKVTVSASSAALPVLKTQWKRKAGAA